MIDYIKRNWDGWPLHSLIAGVLMLPVVSNSYPIVMLLMNIVFWPLREAWQHHGIKGIWSLHRIIEWASPIAVAFIVFGVVS